MTIDNEDANIPALTDTPDADVPGQAVRSWDHIGAIIVDAALQRRQNYHATVRPRVLALLAAWPAADTTSGFRRNLDSGTLSNVISWPSPGRLAQVEDMTGVFERQGIETVPELRDALADPVRRRAFREALAAVRHVTPKTLDYIEALSGTPADAAGDAQANGVRPDGE